MVQKAENLESYLGVCGYALTQVTLGDQLSLRGSSGTNKKASSVTAPEMTINGSIAWDNPKKGIKSESSP